MQRLNINLTARESNTIPVTRPSGSAPHFGPPERLQSPSFWTNLKDLLTERSIKVPRNARQEVFRRDGLDMSFAESFKAFFRSTPRIKGAPTCNMTVDLEPTYRVFWRNLRDLISPPKLPPLKLTSKPVPVPPLWTKRRQYSVAQMISIAAHVVIILLIAVPIARHIVQPTVQKVEIVSNVIKYGIRRGSSQTSRTAHAGSMGTCSQFTRKPNCARTCCLSGSVPHRDSG